MVKLSLDVLKNLLIAEGLKPQILSASEIFPIPHLHLSLDKDFKNRDLELIFWIDQDPGSHIPCLQLFFLYPFHFTDETLSATARYLHILNKSVAFPGFGLSEPDHSLYYKYAFPLPESSSLPKLLKSFIGLTEFLYDTYAPSIEEVAIGDKSFKEIITI